MSATISRWCVSLKKFSPKAKMHIMLREAPLLSKQMKNSHTNGHILPTFSRLILALCVLWPALAGGLINWPFHLVDAHCVSGFVRIWICECMCVRMCVPVCLGTLSELWSVWLPHWGLLSQPLKACNRRPFSRNEYTARKCGVSERLGIIEQKN